MRVGSSTGSVGNQSGFGEVVGRAASNAVQNLNILAALGRDARPTGVLLCEKRA